MIPSARSSGQRTESAQVNAILPVVGEHQGAKAGAANGRAWHRRWDSAGREAEALHRHLVAVHFELDLNDVEPALHFGEKVRLEEVVGGFGRLEVGILHVARAIAIGHLLRDAITLLKGRDDGRHIRTLHRPSLLDTVEGVGVPLTGPAPGKLVCLAQVQTRARRLGQATTRGARLVEAED